MKLQSYRFTIPIPTTSSIEEFDRLMEQTYVIPCTHYFKALPVLYAKLTSVFCSQQNAKTNRVRVEQYFQKVNEELVEEAYIINRDNTHGLNTQLSESQYIYKSKINTTSQTGLFMNNFGLQIVEQTIHKGLMFKNNKVKIFISRASEEMNEPVAEFYSAHMFQDKMDDEIIVEAEIECENTEQDFKDDLIRTLKVVGLSVRQ
ncbi:Mediator_complex [Hexamita inflata]|uniref:Subunit Med18 n=1 Tax=Hexamita inflata TaxID=28002 RepID=A0ABP1HP16_9EUKA